MTAGLIILPASQAAGTRQQTRQLQPSLNPKTSLLDKRQFLLRPDPRRGAQWFRLCERASPPSRFIPRNLPEPYRLSLRIQSRTLPLPNQNALYPLLNRCAHR